MKVPTKRMPVPHLGEEVLESSLDPAWIGHALLFRGSTKCPASGYVDTATARYRRSGP